MEPRYDFVELRDGPSPSSLSIGKFTGDDLPPARYSASGLLYVKFTSDGSVTKKGFKAKFAVVSHGKKETYKWTKEGAWRGYVRIPSDNKP